MRYAVLIYESEEELAKRADPEARDAYIAPYSAYVEELRQAGVFVGGQSLKHPATATTVAVRDGARHVQDGPVAHSREQLGGFMLIDVPDLDAALAWAARCPAATTGRVEVRPTGLEGPS